MNFTDGMSITDAVVTSAGFFEANARTARAGVQQYMGREIGRPDLGMVNVYRDADEVFSHDSLHTFSKIPITLDHPPEAVTADNWRRYAVGTSGEEVLRDGQFLKIGLKITDRSAIDAVRSGKRELSVGYESELVWGDCTALDGTRCQARQTKIRANHIAIVARGRAGSEVRIRDSWGVDAMNETPYERYKRELSDAWKHKPGVTENTGGTHNDAVVDMSNLDALKASAQVAYENYRASLQNAWRKP